MSTPIIDFINSYRSGDVAELHMPGHKGTPLIGAEPLDITEIKGADALFEAYGIIGQSEKNMSSAYGSALTVYSTEGSSLSVKAMLACVRDYFGATFRIAAGRSCHRAFINGCILLDIDPVWIYPSEPAPGLCTSTITPEDVELTLSQHPEVNAVYITSPDYYGDMADISAIAEVCHRRGALLIVDNAHGAYLKFASPDIHPITLGADICCDSAHKTLPTLTGASMVHISKSAPEALCRSIREEMSLFASTSPSYVIMSSLDRTAHELTEGDLPQRIRECCDFVTKMKSWLSAKWYDIIGDEPMKLTVSALPLGYRGYELGGILRSCGVEPELCDDFCAVLMPSPYNSQEDLERVADVLLSVEGRKPKKLTPLRSHPKKVMTLREAYFSPHERIPVTDTLGRVLSRSVLSCQPSVPAALGGEKIDRESIKILKRYGFLEADVVK
ncbi:MAG: aminotransferase class V-fold PLP-dependent enzyme [Ruminococcus sp.]|nr:aminotransferase class V-fold PLP-dependent enzyme [Ruminococcus sp.]